MTPRLVIAALLLTLPLAACSHRGGHARRRPGRRRASRRPTRRPAPCPTPVPDGEVRTSGLVTVLDAGTGPELCLGAVAESYPPQCGGPALEDFDWGDVGSRRPPA